MNNKLIGNGKRGKDVPIFSCIGIAGGILLLLFFGYLFLSPNPYKQVFTDDHYVEFANLVPQIKAAAVSKIYEQERETPVHDGRGATTSAGVRVFYTMCDEGASFEHHYSVSMNIGYTAHAVGETFALLFAKLLGVPYEKLQLEITDSSVHHCLFTLTPEEQQRFNATRVANMTVADVRPFRDELTGLRDRLRWKHEKMPVKGSDE